MGNQIVSKTAKRNSIPTRKKTYEYLKMHILSGSFNPGHRLTEEHLAEELGVSRTPVREALHKLELEGLVQPLETRGFIIPKDSKEEMEELFDIRAILEGYTLRLVSESIFEETLEQLNRFIENAEDALKRQKIDEIFRWNTEFHDTLHNLVSHKRRLYDMIVNVRKYVLRYRKDTLLYLEGAKRALEGHRKIMMALRLRDPDLCERVMRHHIREAKEDALKAMFEQK